MILIKKKMLIWKKSDEFVLERLLRELEAEFEAFKKEFAEKHKQEEI